MSTPVIERASAQDLRRRILGSQTTYVLLALVIMVVVFGAFDPEAFLRPSNIRNILKATSVFLVMATAMTFVIITAGIDLSIGAVLVFSSVVAVKAVKLVPHLDIWLQGSIGLAVALAGGLVWGILNGFLIAKAKLSALIVTLGTLGMAQGAALLISGGFNERGLPIELTDAVGLGRLFGVPYLVIVGVVVAIIGGIVLQATRFGRFTYAIGSNEEAARRAGINVDRHLIKVYGLCGMLSGLAGALSVARFSTTEIGGHVTDNLTVIAGTVIGGTSLFGGIGSVWGTIVGIHIPTVLQNGFIIRQVQPFWQQVAVGVVLILAVYLDQLRRGRRQ